MMTTFPSEKIDVELMDKMVNESIEGGFEWQDRGRSSGIIFTFNIIAL